MATGQQLLSNNKLLKTYEPYCSTGWLIFIRFCGRDVQRSGQATPTKVMNINEQRARWPDHYDSRQQNFLHRRPRQQALMNIHNDVGTT